MTFPKRVLLTHAAAGKFLLSPSVSPAASHPFVSAAATLAFRNLATDGRNESLGSFGHHSLGIISTQRDSTHEALHAPARQPAPHDPFHIQRASANAGWLSYFAVCGLRTPFNCTVIIIIIAKVLV